MLWRIKAFMGGRRGVPEQECYAIVDTWYWIWSNEAQTRRRNARTHLKLRVKRRVLVFSFLFFSGNILVGSAPHLSEQSRAKRSPCAGIYELLRVFLIDLFLKKKEKKTSSKCADLILVVLVFMFLLVQSLRTSVANRGGLSVSICLAHEKCA